MKRKKRVPTKKDLPQPPAGPGAPPQADEAAPTEESKLRAWIDEMDRRQEEEIIQRAGDRLRARQHMEDTLLGLEPGAAPADRVRARRELAKKLGLEPDTCVAPAPDEDAPQESSSRVEQVAQRVEREATDRDGDEFQAHRQLAEKLDLTPGPTTESLEEKGENA